MLESEQIAWKATSRMVSNQTGNLGLFGVPQRLGHPLARNSACSIVPRRGSGCSHQRKRANNKTPAGRRVGRSSISGDNPVAGYLGHNSKVENDSQWHALICEYLFY